VALAAELGTPLYVFDELTLRHKCAEFKGEFGRRYPDTAVIYAGKAFLNKALLAIIAEEGLGLDVVSVGELGIARAAGFPLERVYFHGNNKSAEELRLALTWQVGRIVVDNFDELAIMGGIAGELGTTAEILLRLTPGVDPHTHKYITTGVIDTKFGFSLADWPKAVTEAVSTPNLKLVGLHCHLGSLIFESEPYEKAIEVVLNFAGDMKKQCGFELRELNVGGGFAIQYTQDAPSPPISFYAEAITARVNGQCQKLGLEPPKLVIEPGRSIAGQAGVALYRAGVIKDIPDVRCYVSVDGGMADNIRPALYGARYEAIVANKAEAAGTKVVTIAGKFCESGDILVKDIKLPPVAAGDIIAIPDCGAYCLAMASNYNASLKPAVALVRDGQARLIRRRETIEDLTDCDIV
jgi:diaminopimelate decarboxylase